MPERIAKLKQEMADRRHLVVYGCAFLTALALSVLVHWFRAKKYLFFEKKQRISRRPEGLAARTGGAESDTAASVNIRRSPSAKKPLWKPSRSRIHSSPQIAKAGAKIE